MLDTAAWSSSCDDIIEETTCAFSGYLAGQFCSETSISFRPSHALSAEVCPYCRIVSLTPDKAYQATANDLMGETAGIYFATFPIMEKIFVLPPEVEQYYTTYNFNYRLMPPYLDGRRAHAHTNDMAIMFPENKSQVYIPIEIDGTPGKIIMEVFHRTNAAKLYWDLDGTYMGMTQYIHQMELREGSGIHTLTVTDEKGRVASVSFEIL